MTDLMSKNRFDGSCQLLGENEIGVERNLPREQIDLCDARLFGIFGRLTEQQKLRPVRLRPRPAARNLGPQAFTLVGVVLLLAHCSLSTIHSFWELTALATTNPADNWIQRN